MKRSESRKMTATVQVRATPAEKALLKSHADAFGISVGELCRRTVFGIKPKSKTDLEAILSLAAARADLGRIGGLLKGCLAGVFPNSAQTDVNEVRKLLRQIEVTQNVVIEVVKKLVVKE